MAPRVGPPELSRHHRKPRSRGGKSTLLNVTWLPHAKHQAWHLLFGDAPPEEIAEEINRLYLDPEYRFDVTRRIT